jgi:hypothetical protein
MFGVFVTCSGAVAFYSMMFRQKPAAFLFGSCISLLCDHEAHVKETCISNFKFPNADPPAWFPGPVNVWQHSPLSTPHNTVEQSPSWETNSYSAGLEIPSLLRDPKVHYRVHNSPPLGLILSQLNPVYSTHYFFKNHVYIILPSMSWSPKYIEVFRLNRHMLST